MKLYCGRCPTRNRVDVVLRFKDCGGERAKRHLGAYCAKCDKWIKWVRQDEVWMAEFYRQQQESMR